MSGAGAVIVGVGVAVPVVFEVLVGVAVLVGVLVCDGVAVGVAVATVTFTGALHSSKIRTFPAESVNCSSKRNE